MTRSAKPGGYARAAAVLAADAAFSQVLAERVAVVPRVPPFRPAPTRCMDCRASYPSSRRQDQVASRLMRCRQGDSGGVGPVTDSHPGCRAGWRQLVIPETGSRKETAMHPMFKELFIQADADDLLAEQDRRRRVSRARRARSAMIIRPAAGDRRRERRP